MGLDLRTLKKVRCRFLDESSGKPVPGVVASLSIALGETSPLILPVATLRSDATGYLAFDLQPVIGRGLTDVQGLLVSAPRFDLKQRNLLEALGARARARGDTSLAVRSMLDHVPSGAAPAAPLCIEFPIYVGSPRPVVVRDGDMISIATDDANGHGACTCESPALPSIQSPDACDYALSPYSFVKAPKSGSGCDCCEELAPATLPTQEHGFYRIVIRRAPPDGGASPDTSISFPVDVRDPVSAQEVPLAFAEILEYRQRWFALGHSLGEIKYSLPLAPGESTELAVIEWSRQDQASRTDAVRATEFLEHQLNRDRSIEESIDAGLRESQGGWSWVGGMSTGAAYDAGAYGKYTGNAGVGGSVTNSWGNRNLEADSLQDLHDSITQASASVRSLTSTVIVQASQAEQNVLRTRRVANHNHCHALTVEYYEVLRHFRVETEFLRRRKAVLIPFAPFSFTWELANRYRTVLEAALLDPSVAPGFDAIVRRHLAQVAYTIDAPAPSSTPTTTTTNGSYFSGTRDLTVGATEVLSTGVSIEKDSTVAVAASGQGIKFSRGDSGAGYGPQGSVDTADQTFPAANMHKFVLLAQIGGDFYEIGAGATFTAKNSGPLRFQFNDSKLDDNSGSASVSLTVTRPAQKQAPIDPSQGASSGSAAAKPAYTKAGDELAETLLITHLNGNIGYYDRVVWMQMEPGERRLYLEAALGALSDILSGIDDTPIGVSGNRVAFPYDGPMPAWVDDRDTDPDVPLDSIVTLPTRGLFAEAQLGHCNSCERRDVMRMWDWTEMTAEEPPPISGIQPGPQGQIPTLTPSALPANVIQITTPPNAPDPTGLANALALLKTPEIFRDMSGLKSASDILGKLIDGTNKTLDDMVKGAAEAKAKVDAARGSDGAASGANGSGGAGSTGTGSTAPSAKNLADKFSLLPEIQTFAKDLGLNSTEAKNFARDVILGTNSSSGSSTSPGGTLDDDVSAVTIDLAKYCTPAVRAFSPSTNLGRTDGDKSGRTTVRAVVNNAPAGSTWHWTVASPTAAQIVSPSAYITEIIAGDPGLTDLTFEARDPGGKSLGKATVKLSVPQFAVIDEDVAALGAQLVAYRLDDVKDAVLRRAKQVVDFLLANTNVRTVWRLAPFAEPLPAHLAPGGFAAGKFNPVTIHGASPWGDVAGTTDSAGAGPAKPDEAIDIYPGAYTAAGTDTGADVSQIVARINAANLTDPVLKALWIEIMGRLMGETIAHEICHGLLGSAGFDAKGHNVRSIPFDLMNRGSDRVWLQRTAIEIIEMPNFPAPGSYRDGGVFAISGLQSANQTRLDALFPVPPAFL